MQALQCASPQEGELTDAIQIDTAAIPENVRRRLGALTLDRFNAFMAVPGNAEWLDARTAARKAAQAASK